MSSNKEIMETSRGQIMLNLVLTENNKINQVEKTENSDCCIPETTISEKSNSFPSDLDNNVSYNQACCSTDIDSSVPCQQIFESDVINDDLYISTSEADDTDQDKTYELQEEDSDSDDEDIVSVTRRRVLNKTTIQQTGRKRQRNPQEWLDNKLKAQHAAGKGYINKKGKTISAKTLKPPCGCKFKCFEKITENMRIAIFNQYWDESKDVNVKRQFVASCVESKLIARSRERDGSKPKTKTLIYTFVINNEKVKVCKLMFLNTLCISNRVVINALNKIKDGGIVEPDLRGKSSPANKTSQEVIDSVCKHIATFPSYESHYCRERTQKKFLEPGLSIAQMHRLYLKFCEENNVGKKYIAEYWLYADVFNKKFKLSFKCPGTDTCDTCDNFTAQLKSVSSQEDRDKIKNDYENHLKEAENRYSLKKIDTTASKSNKTVKVLSGDLQKCLPTPLCTSTLSFYKRKLWTFNYTLYDSSDGSASCVMWDESKAGRGGCEIASCILKWADQVIPNSNINEIILWSDNCYGQNQNISLIVCFFWILHKYKQVREINQKFLLKGHTHMEADAVHGIIERKRKQSKLFTISTPWDWQQLIRQCSSKYAVFNMELNDFKNLPKLYVQKRNKTRETRQSITDNAKNETAPFVYRKKDVNNKPLLLSQCSHLQVRQEKIGTLFVKENFKDPNFREVNLRRKSANGEISLPESLEAISDSRKEISTQKFNDLMSLLQFLPSECHEYFKNLPHSKSAADFPLEGEGEEDDDD